MNHRKRPIQRLACDRCHSQKLRCIRGPLPNGACQRCTKARETCQYGPPLRLGRPANKTEPKRVNSAKGASTASSNTINNNNNNWPTDALGRLTEEDASINFSQLGIEAHVFAARNPVFPAIPEMNQTQDGVHTGSSKPESSDFILDDDNTHFMRDWAYVLDSQVTDVTDSSNALLTNSGENLSIDTFPAHHPAGTEPPLQPNAQNDAQRQLSELLKGLYENPCPMTSNTSHARNSSLQLMVETAKAANTLLSITDSLKVLETAASTPSTLLDVTDAAESCVDADTAFLIAACYSRIFRNSNALAIVLYDVVSSNDMSALQSMPSIRIGSLGPFPAMSPAIQSAIWVQLLRQSLRELEKQLLALSRPNLKSPSVPQLSVRSLNKSHVADLAGSIDADVAGLEVSVNHLLKTTLEMLR